ncbi:hypothetical protein F0L68_35265 [Solihabitans fulvus]|uniref:Uncharacterized protein n=1 Tax=Solihabitans fulvus TaxID=1892852 RepID=A0A5B2WMB3_9PSEU|nr:hypothetical protein [Solihabitans fulvus]KAA2252575.1 hypothetical protein F0L68_35265 [Solihabitans fulvus]
MTTDENGQRARESFVDTLWSLVVDEDGHTDGHPSWIESRLREWPDGDATSTALHRLLASGVDPDDLTDVVRQLQHELLYNLCQLIDDPGLLGIGLDEERPDAAEFAWELTAVREQERVPIEALHASLDERDPSGRGGEPRGRPVPVRLPGQPEHVRVALAHALAGDRVAALTVWRKATGVPLGEARAALELLVEQVRGESGSGGDS